MLRAYINLMRIDKPIGIFLLLWPTLWSLWLASGGIPSIKLLSVFILGSFIMRTAGCIINDFTDLKVDGEVDRTKHRALVSGKVTKSNALIILFVLLCLALILAGQLNLLSIKIAIVGIIFTIIYPFLKRYTGMVQFFLGITFALGVPMAFAATNNYIPIYVWILYGINVIWVVAYDTIYAMIDKSDDMKIGVHSTAILFGNYGKQFVFVLQCLVNISLVMYGVILELGGLYLICISFTLALFVHQYRLTLTNSDKNYMLAFTNNNWVGALIFLGFMFADYSTINLILN